MCASEPTRPAFSYKVGRIMERHSMVEKKDMEHGFRFDQERDNEPNERIQCGGEGDRPRPLTARIDGLLMDAQRIKFRTVAELNRLRCSE